MDSHELLKKRITEADRTAYERNILKVCGFLALDEQDIYHSLERSFLTETHFLSGGHEDAERCAAFFLPDYLDAETAEKEYVSAIAVRPVNARFADDLTHRDFLGALMNLGIERECIGDILVDMSGEAFSADGAAGSGKLSAENHASAKDNASVRTGAVRNSAAGKAIAVVFALREMSDFIVRELTKVKHTDVECSELNESELHIQQRFEELSVNIASERVDAVTAAVYRISRQKAAELISQERIFINGRTAASAGKTLKSGDRVSVRGAGKYIFDGISGTSRKGRLFADIRKFL